MSTPVICFGQQPCGIFPRRFLYAKFVTARRLQAEIGGEIVFFYHDSDHDPRETQTIVRHKKTNEPATMNFDFANKIQRKWSPLYAKRVLPEWQTKMKRQLGAYADSRWVDAFAAISAANVADFCLAMYRAMGLLEGIRVVRSGDATLRRQACDIEDYFVDVTFEGELVRARRSGDKLQLHEGGERFVDVPATPYGKEQISPTRDSRLRWMQSVLHCTHYIAGAGEQAYLNKADAPEIQFLVRDEIDHSDEAYIG